MDPWETIKDEFKLYGRLLRKGASAIGITAKYGGKATLKVASVTTRAVSNAVDSIASSSAAAERAADQILNVPDRSLDSFTGLRFWHSKVAGVSHRNRDRTSRQKIVNECLPGETLLATHDEENTHSDTAVKLCRNTGKQVGYLNDRMGAEVIEKWSKGYRFSFHVTEVTGRDQDLLGLNFLVIQADPGVADSVAQQFLNEVWKQEQ